MPSDSSQKLPGSYRRLVISSRKPLGVEYKLPEAPRRPQNHLLAYSCSEINGSWGCGGSKLGMKAGRAEASGEGRGGVIMRLVTRTGFADFVWKRMRRCCVATDVVMRSSCLNISRATSEAMPRRVSRQSLYAIVAVGVG